MDESHSIATSPQTLCEPVGKRASCYAHPLPGQQGMDARGWRGRAAQRGGCRAPPIRATFFATDRPNAHRRPNSGNTGCTKRAAKPSGPRASLLMPPHCWRRGDGSRMSWGKPKVWTRGHQGEPGKTIDTPIIPRPARWIKVKRASPKGVSQKKRIKHRVRDRLADEVGGVHPSGSDG